MSRLLDIGLAAAAIALMLPSAADLMHLGHVPRRRRARRRAAVTRPRLLFLVPAHNEELLVETCLQSLARLDYPADRYSVLVVADNCGDRTADIARAAGAQCLERNDPANPGKPHALAWAVERIPLDQHDAVVIMDADSVVAPDYASAMARAAPLNHKVVQAYNGVANPGESAITRMATVLAAAKFEGMYPLKHRTGINVPLGAGMCIGSAVLQQYGWQAFSIGEDWEFYAFLTERGVPIELQAGARLMAQEARTLRQSAPQRRRWTAGKLTVFRRYWLPLLRSRKIGARQKLDAIAELSAPGPAVHLGIVSALCAAGIVLQAAGWTLALLATTLLRSLWYSGVALTRVPEPGRALKAFALLPVYTLWRLAVECGAWAMGTSAPWVRTARHVSRID